MAESPAAHRRAVRAVGIALLALLATPACDSGPARPLARSWQVAAGVFDFRDGSPRAGISLLLADVEANRPVAGPLSTDADGWVRFAAVPPGRYAVLVYPGTRLGLWRWPGSFSLPPEGEPGPWRADGTATAPVDSVRILSFDRPPVDPRPRIRGRVLAADTGQPLARALVGVAGSIDAYLGTVSPKESATDEKGRFTVEEILFASDPLSGQLHQIEPLVIQREGYRPRSFRLPPQPAQSDLDFTGVEIRLEPLGAVATGGVAGRVVFLRAPVAGIEVGLSFLGEATTAGAPGAADKGRLGQPGAVARTDAEGRFLLPAVPPGIWLVHPAFTDDDGYLVNASAAALTVTVVAGDTAAAGDLPVIRTLQPLAPPPGATITDPRPRFAWGAVAEADSYLVVVDGDAVAATTEPSWQPEQALSPGAHTWGVEAYGPGDEVVGLTDYRPHTLRFLVESPPPGARPMRGPARSRAP